MKEEKKQMMLMSPFQSFCLSLKRERASPQAREAPLPPTTTLPPLEQQVKRYPYSWWDLGMGAGSPPAAFHQDALLLSEEGWYVQAQAPAFGLWGALELVVTYHRRAGQQVVGVF